MKKILFFILLSISSVIHSQSWTSVAKSDDFDEHFFDMTTIQRKGNFIRVWEKSNYKTPVNINSRSSYSARFFQEYDCDEKRIRKLSTHGYTGKDLSGELIYHYSSPTEWQYVAPGTVASEKLNLICKR
jgi:hypothetical protein